MDIYSYIYCLCYVLGVLKKHTPKIVEIHVESEADTPSNKILKTRSDNHLLGEGQGL